MRPFVTVGWMALTLSIIGCGNTPPPPSVPEITQEKFDRLAVGMTPNQVEEVMGETHPRSPGVPVEWTYSKDGKDITVKFNDGKLSEKLSHGL